MGEPPFPLREDVGLRSGGAGWDVNSVASRARARWRGWWTGVPLRFRRSISLRSRASLSVQARRGSKWTSGTARPRAGGLLPACESGLSTRPACTRVVKARTNECCRSAAAKQVARGHNQAPRPSASLRPKAGTTWPSCERRRKRIRPDCPCLARQPTQVRWGSGRLGFSAAMRCTQPSPCNSASSS